MKKALFLDRDGVINEEINYLYKIDDFRFIDGIFNLCRYYQNLGYIIVVVTNQSGIDRGYYNETDFNLLTKWMIEEFRKNSLEIKRVYFCPHHPDIYGECDCRKPNPGMFIKAQKEFDIDMKNSIIIGDKESDIEAGLNAGLKESYLFDKEGIVLKSKANKIVLKLGDIYSVNTK